MDTPDAIEAKPSRADFATSEIEELEKISDGYQSSKTVSSEGDGQTEEQRYPNKLRFASATAALVIAVFLVALDIHILATATPKITTEFDSLLDLTWYGGAYLLAQIALQPTYGRLYQVFPIKGVFLTALIILETGSTIGATSASSRILIIGRAIQGTGAGGLIAGGLLMITHMVPKPKRPLYLSTIGTMYAVAAIVGPVLGGIFAESRVTWRFCFWMNLPIGFTSGIILLFAFPEPTRASTNQPLKKKLMTLDPFGAGLLISWVTCLLLALQRASIPQPWSYSGIWGPLLAFGILLCVFVILQFYQKDQAIVPHRIFAQRTVLFSCLFEVTVLLASTTIVYYLPFYFQSVKGYSPHISGIHILPFVVTNSLFAFLTGIFISKTGIYVPMMWLGASIMMIGCGLLFTLNINSTTGSIVGYQLIASAGYGICVQIPFTAIQVLSDKDIPIGNGLVAFFQGLGGALSISAAQTIFSNSLHHHLAEIPGINVNVIISYGAANIVSKVPAEFVRPVRVAYGAATQDALILPIVGASLALLASFGTEWRRHHRPKSRTDEEEPGVTQREVIEVKK